MLFNRFAFKSYFLISLFANSCVSQNPVCNDCCNNYKEIKEPRRSTKSVWQRGQSPLCDRAISPDWYRFTSFGGSKMPEKVVNEYHCGTHDPIWLKESHPTKAEGNVARKACINSFGMNDGCFDFFYINIVNCGGHFVYYLKPPTYCAAAYCAGFGEPCPYGKEGEPPNCFDPPTEFSAENFGDPHITYTESEKVSVTLICKVPILKGIEKWKNVTYKIEWFAEGNILKSDTRCGGLLPGQENTNACPDSDLVSQLPGNLYKIGQSISCNASAKFTTSPKNVWSAPKQVPVPFFAGLKVYPTVLNLKACDMSDHVITITPTIPVRQHEMRGLPWITFATPPEVDVLQTSCVIELREGIEPVQVKIKAACKQGGITEGLKPIVPSIYFANSRFWNARVGLPTIWVNMKSETTIEQCRSTGDPHYYVLPPVPNGFRRWYDYYGRGDFILYKNTERHFEVHARQWSCGGDGGPTCNCGVVLRDHNDVIEFNACKDILYHAAGSTTLMRVKIKSKKCLAAGISIKTVIPGINSQYEVMFPSGAKVSISRYSWGLDVTVDTPRAVNTANEMGLCLHPGRQNHNTYGENLRLQKGQSYFDTLPPHVEEYIVRYTTACQCVNDGQPNTPQVCKNAFDVAFPTVLKKELSPMFLCDRQKRDVEYSDDPSEEEFQFLKQTPLLRSRVRREVPQEKISKENATNYCAERISETEIGKLCANVGVNLQELVDTCSVDLEFICPCRRPRPPRSSLWNSQE